MMKGKGNGKTGGGRLRYWIGKDSVLLVTMTFPMWQARFNLSPPISSRWSLWELSHTHKFDVVCDMCPHVAYMNSWMMLLEYYSIYYPDPTGQVVWLTPFRLSECSE